MTFKDAQWHTAVMPERGSLRQKDSKHETRKTASQKTANRNTDNVKGVAFKYTTESNDRTSQLDNNGIYYSLALF